MMVVIDGNVHVNAWNVFLAHGGACQACASFCRFATIFRYRMDTFGLYLRKNPNTLNARLKEGYEESREET